MATAGELIELLQMVDEDTEVRLASQPSWPMEHHIKDMTVVALMNEAGEMFEPEYCYEDCDEDCDWSSHAEKWQLYNEVLTPVLYLGEEKQVGYLPGAVAKGFGWTS